ncbi:hypothetical protein APHDU1_0780 [Anaplasma phagocytophilum]|nr:hypothetical protein APHDU1_0780 [Anaplasma phagocytophilum]
MIPEKPQFTRSFLAVQKLNMYLTFSGSDTVKLFLQNKRL